MRTGRQVRLLALFVVLAAVSRCGGGAPTSPSSAGGGATIAGTVRGAGASAPAGLTVAVAGTNLSTGVEPSGNFQLPGVPAGDVQLQFKNASNTATAQLANVGNDELIQIQVQVNGSSATILSETRSSGKVSLCHRTESGTYQSIEVSVNAEPAHRAHGDGKVGEQVPGDPSKVFGSNCQPTGAAVRIKKATNGQDADDAPGPTVPVGSTVTWTYVVTNTGNVPLTGVSVSDNPHGAVACPKATLAVGESMTCTATGVATAGQYRNVGTVTASWTSGTVTDSDASHYFGQSPTQEEEGPKVQLCHRTGNGSYHLIEVSINAEPAHRAHGDGKIGESVPGSPGKVFGTGCVVQ
jgi:uncharacterized repeat protein (TIGR01451 family)